MVLPAPVHPDQELRTGQLRRRHRHQQLTSRAPTATLLDLADPGVQGLPDAQHPVQLGDRGHPACPVNSRRPNL